MFGKSGGDLNKARHFSAKCFKVETMPFSD